MNKILFLLTAVAAGAGACNATAASHKKAPPRRAAGLEQIKTIVVVYAENRGFDHLYGFFPGANGLRRVTRAMSAQHDRDGTVMKELPPVWGGLTARGVTPPVTEAQTEHLPNAPFAIDDPKGFNAALDVISQSPPGGRSPARRSRQPEHAASAD
jgi:phospholipase C